MSRAKIRPCKKACGYPALKGRQFCQWHALLRSSSDEQAAASRNRLAAAVGEHRPRVPKSEWPEGERWCAGCQSFVPKFYASGSRCKACASLAAHERRVEAVYGITPEQYAEIFRRQGGKCAVCRATPRTIRFAVDHDHKSGEVRGILCKRCNHDLLGGGHDDLGILWRAITYLLFPPAQERVAEPTNLEVFQALGAFLQGREAIVQGLRRSPATEEPPPF